MIREIYAIFDKKAEYHITPLMFVRNRNEAIRSVQGAVNSPGSMLHDYPFDFALYSLGRFDENSGAFVEPVRKLICECSSLVDVVSKDEKKLEVITNASKE